MRTSTLSAFLFRALRRTVLLAMVGVASGLLFRTVPIAYAQTQPRPSLSPASSLDLPRLVDLAAERLSIRVEYDPSTLKGSLTLRIPDSLSNDELWTLTNHTLATRGFTTIRLPGSDTFSVVKLSEAAALSAVRPTPSTPAAGPQPGFVTEFIRVEHRPAKDIIEPLKIVLSKPGGAAAAIGDSGLIAISDLTPRVDEARKLLATLDTPAATIVEEIPTTSLSAAQLAALVMQVWAKRESVSGQKTAGEVIASPNGGSVLLIAPESSAAALRSLVTSLDRREGVATVTYTPRYFAADEVARLAEQTVRDAAIPDERWKLVVDALTGSLIVTATPTQHTQIATLINRLDAQPEGVARPVRSFPIRNRPVSELATTLSQLIEAGALESSDAAADRASVSDGARQRTVRPISVDGAQPTSPVGTAPLLPESAAAPRSSTHARGSTLDLSLTADEATNTLIAIGEPRLLSQLETLLEMLDVRQPQVMLEVKLISLTDNEALTLGVELEKLGTVGDAAYKLSSLFGLSTSTAAGVRTVADAAGFTGAVLSPGDYSVIVRALETLNKGRSLSNPKLLVTNNEQAVFSSVLQQPVASRTVLNGSETSAYAGTEDAGTTISVKPQIAQGDHLVLTYSIKLSSFVGSATAESLPPPRQQNSVDSVATIPDGHTVVVGGLELTGEGEGASQIPLLGRIPILGYLFKTESTSSNRTRFYVFIRATVLRHNNFEDLKYLSAKDAGTMGIDDGFPEVLPRVIR